MTILSSLKKLYSSTLSSIERKCSVPIMDERKSSSSRRFLFSIFTSGISLLGCSVTLLIGGCAVGPDYKRADTDTPAAYTESKDVATSTPTPTSTNSTGEWKPAVPMDDLAKGKWWEVYNDGKLNELEDRAAQNNQDLKVEIARVDQARAVAHLARSQFFPTANLNASGSEFRESANRPVAMSSVHQHYTASDVQLGTDVSYELDIWGRVRRAYEAARANFQATVAEYETVRLTLHADVAQNYFNLRSADAQVAILRDTLEIRRKAFDLIKIRYQGGVSNELDLAQAETLYANAQSDLAAIQKSRAELEHALAILLGATPESFHMDEHPLAGEPPTLPIGVPSELLERRPDVAQAERTMASANASIGVAKAAFFPVVQLTGAAGFESIDVGSLFDWPSRLWSIGPSLTLPIFDAGRNEANLTRAEAAYLQTVAQYRGQVLIAFREVEDGLSGLHYLSDQAAALQRAVVASQRAYDLSNIRYRDGLVTFLDVVDTQRTALENQLAAAQNLSQRYDTNVLLIKALGGGWKESSIATAK